MGVGRKKVISVFDTTIAEINLGNEIIMDAIYPEFRNLFADCFLCKLPSLQITKSLREYIERSDYVFFGGTNALSSQMNRYKQWDMNLRKTQYVHDVILLGVGWWQYQDRPNRYTQMILKRALSKDYIHSVRDNYTAEILKDMGFSVLNTGCPTTWGLIPEIVENINNRKKAKNVVMTLTDYNRDRNADQKLLDMCLSKYEKVYIWLQGIGDMEYLSELKNAERLTIIDSRLEAYDKILEEENVDYVGTRLHAGIRALQKQCHAYIIAIDNRAAEMGKDILLPIKPREQIEELGAWLEDDYRLNLKVNWDAISKWRQQFRKGNLDG